MGSEMCIRDSSSGGWFAKVEPEADLTNLKLVSIRQLVTSRQDLTVNSSSVPALKILNVVVLTFAKDSRMVAAHGNHVDDHIVAGVPTESRAFLRDGVTGTDCPASADLKGSQGI